MAEVRSGDNRGAIFADVRGEDRGMRITHHPELGIVVVSLWLGPLCRGSFRLPADDVDRLVAALTAGREVTISPGEMRTAEVAEPDAPSVVAPSAVGPSAVEPAPDAVPEPAGKPAPPRTGSVDPAAIAAATTVGAAAVPV